MNSLRPGDAYMCQMTWSIIVSGNDFSPINKKNIKVMIVSWILGNKLQWNLKLNMNSFFLKMLLEMLSAKWPPFSSCLKCVKACVGVMWLIIMWCVAHDEIKFTRFNILISMNINTLLLWCKLCCNILLIRSGFGTFFLLWRLFLREFVPLIW